MLRNTRGGAMPLVHGPHRVKSSIIEPLRTRLSTPHSYGRCARQTRQRRARGHLHPEVVTPSNAAAVPDARARGACGQARVWVTVAASANALASCLVSMPRARIHAEIRRAGAFGQRGGTRLLRHTRGGAMPLVRGPQNPQTNRGRPIANECMRPPDAMPRSRSRLYCGRVARAPHLADGHHDERVDLCGAAGIRNDDGTWMASSN